MSHHPGFWDIFLVWVQSHVVMLPIGPCGSMVWHTIGSAKSMFVTLCIKTCIPNLTVGLEFPDPTFDGSRNRTQMVNRDFRDDVRGQLSLREDVFVGCKINAVCV
jgi:hypothetical protein